MNAIRTTAWARCAPLLAAIVFFLNVPTVRAADPLSVTVTGQVIDTARRPMPGARVELRDDATVLGTAVTAADGRYRIAVSLKAGEYTAIASAGAARRVEVPVRVLPWAEGETLVVDLVVTPLTRATQTAAKPGYTTMRVYYATDRSATGKTDAADFYTGQRGDGLELGTADVSIPKDHRLATLETPSIWNFEFKKDPNRHVVLLQVTPGPSGPFFEGLKARIGTSKRKEAFVFVHGFLVTFEDAARTTAQLAYDLQFDGAPILYSWPSGEHFYNYGAAESNAEWSTGHFVQFLTQISEQTGAQSVHVIAHSMGNRLVAGALNEIAMSKPSRLPLFNQIVMAAADIDADVFSRLAARVVAAGSRVTMYVSENDMALKASMKFHSYPRAGFAGSAVKLVPGVETIDASAVDSSMIGHFYYGESRSVIADLHSLLKTWTPVSARRNVTSVNANGGTLWRLLPGAR